MKKSILKIMVFYTIVLMVLLGIALIAKNNEKNIFEIKSTNYANVYDFQDGSWFILDRNNNEYVFQPMELGDWDITLNNEEELKKVLSTYFMNKYNIDENTAIKNVNKILENIK